MDVNDLTHEELLTLTSQINRKSKAELQIILDEVDNIIFQSFTPIYLIVNNSSCNLYKKLPMGLYQAFNYYIYQVLEP